MFWGLSLSMWPEPLRALRALNYCKREGLIKVMGLILLEMLTKYKTIDIFEFTKGYPGLQLFSRLVLYFAFYK